MLGRKLKENLPSMSSLRVFDAVARHYSYSAAARELGVTHAAISHRIHDLETRLGALLFERCGNSMVPTREGEHLLVIVREALDILQRALPGKSDRTPPRLAISVAPVLNLWFAARLEMLSRAHSGMSITFRPMTDLPEPLEEDVDIVLDRGADRLSSTAAELLSQDTLAILCTPQYQLEHRLREPKDLAHCTLLRQVEPSWQPWLHAASVRLPTPTRSLVIGDDSLLVSAVMSGLGVASLPMLAVRDQLERGQLVQLFSAQVPDCSAYYLVNRHRGVPSAPAHAFCRWLRRMFVRSVVEPEVPQRVAAG